LGSSTQQKYYGIKKEGCQQPSQTSQVRLSHYAHTVLDSVCLMPL